MANRAQFRISDFLAAIPGSGGVIATIASRVGCEWHTAKKYIEKYPKIKAAYEDEAQITSDIAVDIVLKAIKSGDTSTAKWWLSKKRREEFGESLDVSVRRIESMTSDELRIIAGLQLPELEE